MSLKNMMLMMLICLDAVCGMLERPSDDDDDDYITEQKLIKTLRKLGESTLS